MPELFLGLMSGTSVDAVDGALVDLSARHPHVLGFASRPIDAALRSELLALQAPGADELERAARARRALTLLYAEVAAALHAPGVRAVGAHGQTVRHRPEAGYTIQLLDGALLAERAGLEVVCDFRSADLAAGGQGAPLVPAFHAAAFAHPARRRAVVNIGGIANVSLLAPGEPVRGYDCGPGNALLDAWSERNTASPFDAGGRWAASEAPDEALLAALLADPYFSRPAPKSTGRELFNLQWLDAALARHAGAPGAARVQSTLAQLTAESIARACESFGADEVFACGGGVRNADLMRRLQARLAVVQPGARASNPGARAPVVHTTAQLGVDPQAVEAVAFAWLAARRVNGQAANLPAVTGARGERQLGAVYPAPPAQTGAA